MTVTAQATCSFEKELGSKKMKVFPSDKVFHRFSIRIKYSNWPRNKGALSGLAGLSSLVATWGVSEVSAGVGSGSPPWVHPNHHEKGKPRKLI